MTDGSVFEGGGVVSSPLEIFIVQLLLIVVFSRVIAFLIKPLKQPPVIAEIVAGILLGPSALCRNLTFKNHIFPATSLGVLTVFANVGLIIFLFIIGLEADLNLLTKGSRQSLIISGIGIALPFGLGAALSKYLYDEFSPPGSTIEFGTFLLFIGCATSITAFPVLARILTERKLLNTPVGLATIGAAAIDDVTAWCILALVVSLVRAGSSKLVVLYTTLTAIGLILFLVLLVRPLLRKLAVMSLATRKQLPHSAVVLCFMGMFLFAWMTEWIGIHAIFGAFAFGLVVPREGGLNTQLCEKLEDLIVSMFLPLYFTLSGLKTNLGLISSGKAGGGTILIILVAVAGKFGGCTAMAKYCGYSVRHSLTIGILMNTKGLVELVVLNIGLDNGIISPQLFSMCVVMALFCTFITTPLTYLTYPKHMVIKDMVGNMTERLNAEGNCAAVSAGVQKQEPNQVIEFEIPTQRRKKEGRGFTNVVSWLNGDNATSFPLMTLTASIVTSKGERNVSLLKLTDTSSRPSSYMRHMVSAGDPKSQQWRSMLGSHAQMLQIGDCTEVVTFSSDSQVNDVCEVARMKNAEIIVAGFPAPDSFGESDGSSTEAINNLATMVTSLATIWRSNLGVFIVRGMPAVMRSVVCAVESTESVVSVENDILAMHLVGQMAKTRAAGTIALLITGSAQPELRDYGGSTSSVPAARGVVTVEVPDQDVTGSGVTGDSVLSPAGSRRSRYGGLGSQESSFRIRNAMQEMGSKPRKDAESQASSVAGDANGEADTQVHRLAEAIEIVLTREQKSKKARKITQVIRKPEDSLEHAIRTELETLKPDLLVLDYDVIFGDADQLATSLTRYVLLECKCSVLLARRDVDAVVAVTQAGSVDLAEETVTPQTDTRVLFSAL